MDLRAGDKVMQIENDYDKDVYNGDIGFVVGVEPEEGELTASFDGRSVTYEGGQRSGPRARPVDFRADHLNVWQVVRSAR